VLLFFKYSFCFCTLYSVQVLVYSGFFDGCTTQRVQISHRRIVNAENTVFFGTTLCRSKRTVLWKLYRRLHRKALTCCIIQKNWLKSSDACSIVRVHKRHCSTYLYSFDSTLGDSHCHNCYG
jgi:hypothetical protein